MAAEGTGKKVKIEAGVDKLDETVQELEHVVEDYQGIAEDYQTEDIETSEINDTVQSTVTAFEAVFEDQEWLGQSTAEMIDKELSNGYEKFITYQGLVRAAGRIHGKDQDRSDMERPRLDQSNVRDKADEIIETWNNFLEVYSTAIEAESRLRDISLEKGAEEKGIDPYAFDTAFMELQTEYKRVSDLNEFVENSYRRSR